LQMVSGRADTPFSQGELAAHAGKLTELIDEDQRAFAVVIALQSADNAKNRTTDPNFEQAVVYAIEVPLAIVKVCLAGLIIVQQAILTINSMMISEMIVAAEALQAGVASSLINMEVNLSLLQSAETAAAYACLIVQYRQQGKQLLATIYQQAAASMSN
jgi:formiminotetrahydrofolate cyclodeaminase